MTRRLVALACVVLLGVGCSESLDRTTSSAPAASLAEPAAAVTEPPGTEPPATEPPATELPAAEAPPATTAAPSTTTAPTTTAAAAAPVIPKVVCSDATYVYFAYENTGDEVVVVDPSASALTGVDTDDEPFVPTVFAPGLVSPAFMALPSADPDGPATAWSITGSDGAIRTASLDGDTPSCTDDLLQPTTPDPRTPELEVTDIVVSADRTAVTADFELTGVPRLSVCNEVFEPEPVSVRLEDPSGKVLAQGPSVTLTRNVFDYRSSGPGAGFVVSAVVIDNCSYDGRTFSSWPLGAPFQVLFGDPMSCVLLNDDGSTTLSLGSGCSDLPATGGTKIRTG